MPAPRRLVLTISLTTVLPGDTVFGSVAVDDGDPQPWRADQRDGTVHLPATLALDPDSALRAHAHAALRAFLDALADGRELPTPYRRVIHGG